MDGPNYLFGDDGLVELGPAQHGHGGNPGGAGAQDHNGGWPGADLSDHDDGGDTFDHHAQQAAVPHAAGSGDYVFLSADSREVHFALSRGSETGHWGVRQHKFFFVGVRFVRFADREVPVGWCSHEQCPQHSNHVHAVFASADYPDRQSVPFIAGHHVVCSKAAQLLDAWGGAAGLRTFIGQQHLLVSPAGETQQQQFWPTQQREALAIRAGPQFDDWAVLLPHRDVDGWFCTHPACSGRVHACRHVVAAGHEGEYLVNQTMDAASFNKKFERDFDLEAGMQSLSQDLAVSVCFSVLHMARLRRDHRSGCLPACPHKCMGSRLPTQSIINLSTFSQSLVVTLISS